MSTIVNPTPIDDLDQSEPMEGVQTTTVKAEVARDRPASVGLDLRNEALSQNVNLSTSGSAAGSEVIASSQDDTIIGTFGADILTGGDGDDSISGLSGTDSLIGGQGEDTITGGSGSDTVDGGFGNDEILGGSGDDLLEGGADDDTIDGGTGNDRIYGDRSDGTGFAGNDELFGGEGDDSLFGGNASDTLRGGEGTDQLTGGQGEDVFEFLVEDVEPGIADTITDFSKGDGDKIRLQGFGADPNIVYDNASGSLTVNGNTIAQLDPNLNLNDDDFEIL